MTKGKRAKTYTKEDVINILYNYVKNNVDMNTHGYYACRDFKTLKPDLHKWFEENVSRTIK